MRQARERTRVNQNSSDLKTRHCDKRTCALDARASGRYNSNATMSTAVLQDQRQYKINGSATENTQKQWQYKIMSGNTRTVAIQEQWQCFKINGKAVMRTHTQAETISADHAKRHATFSDRQPPPRQHALTRPNCRMSGLGQTWWCGAAASFWSGA